MDMRGSVAVVTGGAKGIGEACVTLLRERGAEVFVLDRESEHPVDVANAGQVREAVDDIARRAGHIDALIMCAGVLRFGTAVSTTDEDWNYVVGVNLYGAWHAARAVIPHMRQRGGSIVAISSVQALASQNGVFAYTVSKHAMVGMVRSIAMDFAADSIRANAVCPGTVDTPMLKEAAAADPSPQSVYDACAAMHPLGRIAQPREIAEVAVFLASAAASFVTGSVWTVDGGLLTRIGGAPRVDQ